MHQIIIKMKFNTYINSILYTIVITIHIILYQSNFIDCQIENPNTTTNKITNQTNTIWNSNLTKEQITNQTITIWNSNNSTEEQIINQNNTIWNLNLTKEQITNQSDTIWNSNLTKEQIANQNDTIWNSNLRKEQTINQNNTIWNSNLRKEQITGTNLYYNNSNSINEVGNISDNFNGNITDASNDNITNDGILNKIVSWIQHIRETIPRHRRHLTTKKHKKPKKPTTEMVVPPYLWTFDKTRSTVNFWGANVSNPFNFCIAFFNQEEAIANFKRERKKPQRDFSKFKGPRLQYYPNGTRIRIKRKYSWHGDDDPISNETIYHRKCVREMEEYFLRNESVSSDNSRTEPVVEQFTRRMKLRTRPKYKNWTFWTPKPGVKWSPDVSVNHPPSDFFYESQFVGIGSETIEQYYESYSKIDYNDSLFKLPDDWDGSLSKYKELENETPPDFFQLFNTDKTHYDSNE